MLDSLVGSTRASYTGWLGNRCSVLGVSHMLGVSHTHGAMPALHAWTCSSCCSNVTKQEHARGAFSVTGHVYNRVLLNVAHCNRQPCVVLLSELQDQHCCESETHRQKQHHTDMHLHLLPGSNSVLICACHCTYTAKAAAALMWVLSMLM